MFPHHHLTRTTAHLVIFPASVTTMDGNKQCNYQYT